MALRDRDGDGVADERNKFGDGHGSEVVLFDGYLYAENGSDILRYRLPAGSLSPTGDAEKVVVGLPTQGHGAKTFTIARDGALYVNVGSRTNACQSYGPKARGARCRSLHGVRDERRHLAIRRAQAQPGAGPGRALRSRHPEFRRDHDQPARWRPVGNAAWPRPARRRRRGLAEALQCRAGRRVARGGDVPCAARRRFRLALLLFRSRAEEKGARTRIRRRRQEGRPLLDEEGRRRVLPRALGAERRFSSTPARYSRPTIETARSSRSTAHGIARRSRRPATRSSISR